MSDLIALVLDSREQAQEARLEFMNWSLANSANGPN